MNAEGRPESVVELLVHVAEFLDLGDRLTEAVSAKLGKPREMGHQVQDDVRRLAAVINARPGLDEDLYAALYEEKS